MRKDGTFVALDKKVPTPSLLSHYLQIVFSSTICVTDASGCYTHFCSIQHTLPSTHVSLNHPPFTYSPPSLFQVYDRLYKEGKVDGPNWLTDEAPPTEGATSAFDMDNKFTPPAYDEAAAK